MAQQQKTMTMKNPPITLTQKLMLWIARRSTNQFALREATLLSLYGKCKESVRLLITMPNGLYLRSGGQECPGPPGM